MAKRTDIKTILLIGAGPIVIGQACEFDYSGTQACKALREEGYKVILINSNPATIMTDPEVADRTYIEPITPEFVERIIEKEKPDALLPTMGGQTALNCAKTLAETGVLEKHGVELIGANLEAINKAENRSLFQQAMTKIGLECPKSGIAHTPEEAREVLKYVGLPAVIRPSFTLGGTGGGIAYNREEFEEIIASGLDASPTNEVLIDESVLGWKEFEMEVVRDKADNCIIICSIENIDPMGVHTGDSITVAPALTLTDKEYQIMRDASIAVLREIGVDTGGSNVQFAVNPADGRMVVIEMNPRVSRSSALASKATGFPIAKVAAKLAVGYTLDEIANDITRVTPASFEPTIDYIVTKIPRFAFEKFPDSDKTLTTAMKSVGEAMAIGRCFAESLQKALCSLETGLSGFNEIAIPLIDEHENDTDALRAALARPTSERLLYVGQAMRMGMSLKEIHKLTSYDPWFLEQIEAIINTEKEIRVSGLPKDRAGMLALKKMGFSDKRLGEITGKTAAEIRSLRQKLNVKPVFKRVDTCAAEFESQTSYMYSCYEGDALQEPENEAIPSNRRKVIILGSGPNRIGQGIEFDYCCVRAALTLREEGFETIMVNCNPETVSTDYDTSDRLYFEPLDAERVLDIIDVEKSNGELLGVVLQFGGQTPLKLASTLVKEGVNILGTNQDSIDLAEDRERFKQLITDLKLRQPPNEICHSEGEVMRKAETLGYPLVVRPSYVLGGRAMAIIHNEFALKSYLSELLSLFGDGPILLDSYLRNAIEVDVDALADGDEVFVAGIMEHIEEAGIHSGDSACSLPSYSLPQNVIAELKSQTVKLANALKVIGLMNVQFAVQDGEIFILEVNPRASRTVPFVAKATGNQLAKIAASLMIGKKLKDFKLADTTPKHISVKEAVFPFARFNRADVILGPEMKSTGEVMGIGKTFAEAYAKAYIGSGSDLPESGKVFISVKDYDKESILGIARDLTELGFEIVSTRGTANFLETQGISAGIVNKVREGRPHIVDLMKDNGISLVLNTTEGRQSVSDSFSIRRTALLNKIPYSTTISGARALVQAIRILRETPHMEVTALQDYL
jgi:carbamoyl-phosphate synthase large subunit